ncbi:hypothetical protein [Burkholderia gladioli]|uniref:hypothetical protein n=1 Tax=Burkholderia gladioli TaxID=28095 RepID=UPI0011B282F0|nr:hypothetical protein [Burkholderia gladioli]
MKKFLLSLLLIPALALAQSYPTPTFNSLNLQTPLTPANGGTGTTSATGTGSVVRSSSPTIASPTITGSLSASGATFSSGISANGVTSTSNFVGPNAYSIYTSTGINNGGGIQVFDASHGNYVGILNNGTTVGQFASYGATIGSSVYPTIVAPINTTATTTNGSANITVTSAAGITTGMGVYGSFTGGCSGPSAAFQQSYVTAISGTTVTMSCASTATNSSPVAVQFGQQRYSTTSTLIASDLGAQTLKVGAASQGNSSAWLNQVSGGNDYRLTAAAQVVAPPSGGYGLVVGSRSSDATSGAAAFPIASFLYLDSWGNSEYGSENLYLQDNLLAATAGKGPHIQFEQSINSQWGSPPAEDPYSINKVNQTIGHRYDCGTGQSTTSGLNGCTSAIDIVPNPQTFENGIVIANGAIDTSSGSGVAMSMPLNVGLTWYSAASTYSASMYSASAGNLSFFVPSGGAYHFAVNGTNAINIGATSVSPAVSGAVVLGGTSNLWAGVYSASYWLNNMVSSSTAPTISSGFGTGATISGNGTAAFKIVVGTSPGSGGTLTMPAASNGWVCDGYDLSQINASAFYFRQTGYTTTSVTMAMYNTSGATANIVAGDTIIMKCSAF